MMVNRAKRIVICGGGAIGVAIAYFLSRRGAAPIVIERHQVAGSASGSRVAFWRSTGAAAARSIDWRGEASTCMPSLPIRSAIPGAHRRLETYGGYAVERRRTQSGERPWLSEAVAITGRLGSPQTTALVEPRAFTTGLMAAAEKHGGALRHGTAVDLMRDNSGAVRGVVLDDGEIVEGDGVVIAMGPVDPGDALAAAARGVRLQGPQPHLPNR